MKKRIVLFLITFLIFPYLAYSIKTFVLQETEKLSLQTNAKDPDAGDNLTVVYSSPFNALGEWQTKYGDAGQYKSTVTVSDGYTSASEDVLIIVNKKEEPPEIESYLPREEKLDIKESESILFKVLASDVNNDELTYAWYINDEKTSGGSEFLYEAKYGDAGSHKIRVEVSDGNKSATKEWTVEVNKIDVQSLLDGIRDITSDENDIVKLELPDFAKYGLNYSISEPIGNKNEWHTSYDDSGVYEVNVHAEGKGFYGDKIVKVTVNDVDRPLVFDTLENKVVNENEEIRIILQAHDPDGDNITFSANKLPEGATLEGNIFTWRPSYDTVKKEDFVDRVLDKFGALSKSFYIKFSASSREQTIIQNIIITVRDINRAPVIEDMEPIKINEGEIIKIVPNAYDLDGDKVRLTYSGFMNTDTYESKFGDAGNYTVKITASDGVLEAYKSVKIVINHVNRAPIFEKIQDIKSNEGDNIAVLLNAHDPDGDELTYSLDNPPQGSSIKGNAFLWTPSFNFAIKKETKKIDLVFVAHDGTTETRQIAKVEITDKNQAPKIINATGSLVAKVNEPVLMFVKAIDQDGDELTYTWDFGIFEKYKATPAHQRIFTTPGAKVVKVIVSDGTDETEQIINVNVI